MRINIQFIKGYIDNNDLTINSFSRRANINGVTMWRILHGQKSLRTDNLIKIIKAMHLKRSDIPKIFSCSRLYNNVKKKESSEN